MNLLSVLLQIDVQLTAATCDNTLSTSSGWSNSAIIILIGVAVNTVLMIIKFFLDRSNGRKEIQYYRTKQITNLSIEKEANLYLKLMHLSLYTKGEEHEMLDYIIDIESQMSSNRIFYSKKIYEKAVCIIDYYKSINSNLTKKDIRKEEKLLNEYHNLYYDQ